MLRALEKRILPKDGETACGDIALVRTDGAHTLLAVIDALGHGRNAAAVAQVAEEWLLAARLDEGVGPLITGLHGALRGGRGACGLVCVEHEGWLEGCSVGNIDMRWSKSKPTFVLTPGVLGQRVERPRVFRMQPKTERVVMFSDGISARFDLSRLETLSTAEACHAIFSQHRRAHDDATVVVADFEG